MGKYLKTDIYVDSQGREYDVDSYQEMIDTSTFAGKSSTPGMRYAICEGKTVNHVDSDTIELASGKVLKRK